MTIRRISSPQNPRVKQAIKLRNSRQRQKQGRFFVDGQRELVRGLDAGLQVVEAFICPEYLAALAKRETVERLQTAGAELFEVPSAVFELLAYGDRIEGIVAVAETPRRTLDDLVLPPNPLVAVLDRVEKPGNIGAVVRSADAAGVSALIVTGNRMELYNPNTIRASLGTIFSLPICTATSESAIAWLVRRGLHIFTANADVGSEYTEVDFTGPAAIVLGSEAHGLSPCWATDQTTPVRLPMLGVADSLNVSVAAAVLFYEALRQRRCGHD